MFGQWSFDPPVVLVIGLTLLLYARGQVRLSRPQTALRRWQIAAFILGLMAVFAALESPVDAFSATLFWVHMVQHLLLIMVAAPLLVAGDGAAPILRGVPLRWRRPPLRYVGRQPAVRRSGHMLAWLMSPRSVLIIFLVDLYVWHWRALFDLTLRNDSVHLVEHLCFLTTALLFWSRVIDQRGVRTTLAYAHRVVYVLVAAFSSNVLAMYLVFAPRPIYAPYADLASRLYGISALADQQLAGAIMWVPSLFIFGGIAAVLFFKLLGQEDWAQPQGTYRVISDPLDTEPSAVS